MRTASIESSDAVVAGQGDDDPNACDRNARNSHHRFPYLDGLRGIASLSVCFWHNFLAFFPGSVSPEIPIRSRVLEVYIYRSPLNLFFAGDFAVYIFFVLSGFVISVKFFRRGDHRNALKASFFRRYVRLMPPAFVTVIGAYVLLSFHLMYNKQAEAVTGSWWLALNWQSVVVNPVNAVWMGSYGMWSRGIPAQEQFNSNLGTLFIEFLGSIEIFSFILVMKYLNARLTARLISYLILISFSIWLNAEELHYIDFFLGMIIADLYVTTSLAKGRLASLSSFFIIIGLFLGTMNISNSIFPIYRQIARWCLHVGVHPFATPWAVGAVSLVIGTLLHPRAQRLFNHPFFQLLGRYSFSLYLCHTVILGSATCLLVSRIVPLGNMRYSLAIATSFVLALPALGLATYLVEKVDRLSVRVARAF